MNQIFEEFRTILLHQSNCFLPFCQHQVHGINKNEGLLSFANQAQKLCSNSHFCVAKVRVPRVTLRWGILSLKVLPIAVVSTFRQFCSTLCSAKLSTRPVKEEARRRSADQLNEPPKLSLLSLLLSKSGPLLGSATQNQLPERSCSAPLSNGYPHLHFREAKVRALLLSKSEAFGRARRGFYPYTFTSLNPPSGGSEGSNCRNRATFAKRKCTVTLTLASLTFASRKCECAHFCLAKVRPSAKQEGGSESYSAVCSARLASLTLSLCSLSRSESARNSLLCASTRSSASLEPKKLKREPKYSNRVGFTTFLGNTGVKWDAGTKLLDCRRLPFSTLLGQSKARFGLSLPALCNNATNTKYKIIRPLLNLSRENLTILCKDLYLPVYPDKSNKAVQYSRNRLREQILPAIKLFLNPKIDHALFKLAELLTQDFSLVSNLVNTGRRSTSPLARGHPSGEQGLPGT